MTLYTYLATVDRWVDGDTVDMVIDLGFRMSTHQRFRLLGVDTPERGEPKWAEATACCNAVLPAEPPIAKFPLALAFGLLTMDVLGEGVISLARKWFKEKSNG